MRAFAALLLLAATAVSAAPRGGCDADCLRGLATRYVAALAERGSSARLPWAARVRYSENGVPMMVDDGIWATVTASGPKPLVMADPAAGQVVWIGEVEEHGQPSFLALRLRAEGDRIAEAEAVIRRQQGRPPFVDPKALAFDAGFTGALSGARMRRVQLETAARAYLLGKDGGPTALDCARSENGLDTGDCAPRFRSGMEGVRGLAFPVVDEAGGLIVATGTRDYAAASGSSFAPEQARFPHSLAFVAVLKMRGGALARVQEVTTAVPYLMPTWAERP